MLKGKQTSHGIFTWSLENENTHNRVQQLGDPRIILSVCVCRERRGLRTSRARMLNPKPRNCSQREFSSPRLERTGRCKLKGRFQH